VKRFVGLLPLLPLLLAPAAGAWAETPAPAAATAASQPAPGQGAAAPAAAGVAAAPRTVLILLYPEVELFDFAAPYEVFRVTSELDNQGLFRVLLAAETPELVRVHNGMLVKPDCVFSECPQPAVLLVPGGAGVMQAIDNPALVDYIRSASAGADKVVSVCVGAFLLAKAGLLQGQKATTHQLGLGYLSHLEPKAAVLNGPRWTDNGKVLTSAGMTAGLDLAFHVVSQLLGVEKAKQAATYMEYPWKPAP
jgi:transcriptional regulator GlxA family with amidase domain